MNPTATQQQSILCVDDEVAGLRLRAAILRDAGFNVITASTPEEALQIFSTSSVDLVISDHLLGRQTGTQMAHEMKSMRRSVPILIVSGTTEIPSDISNADAFLSKLEGPDQLVAKVRDMLADANRAISTPSIVEDLAKAYEELRLSKVRLEGIVASTMDAIITVDEQQRIVLFNAAAERIFGYKNKDILGRTLDGLIPQSLRAAHRVHIKNFGETGVTTRTMHSPRVLNALRSNGEEFPIEATISQVDAAGQKLFTVVLRDMTERKRAEEELQKSERLAQAGRMAATVAHEINNPLESVTNALYLVARSPSLDDDARAMIKVAQDELARVVQITKLTLGFSRQEESVRSDTSVTDVIENILALYGRKMKTLNIKVVKQYKTERKISAVAGELRQVFANLIVNSGDALSDVGDQLTIRVAESVDWHDLTRRGVRVSICDNGVGISPEQKAHLFEPFFSTKGQKGTGLGLWVSLGIVKKHNGTLRLRSSQRPGRSGTVFSVFLPG